MRTVAINEQIAIAMRKQLERTPRGHKLLVPDDIPTDRAINHLQSFIMRYRGEVRDVDSDRPMTFHGLRHTYAVLSLQNEDHVKTVQGNLEHATAAFTLDVYGHVSERMKDDSSTRMQAYIEAIQ